MTRPTSRAARAAAAFKAAVDFLAIPGRADRYLAVHHPETCGRCASCGYRWPCTVAVLAQRGAEKAARDARNAARLAAALAAPEDTPAPRKPATEPIREAS